MPIASYHHQCYFFIPILISMTETFALAMLLLLLPWFLFVCDYQYYHSAIPLPVTVSIATPGIVRALCCKWNLPPLAPGFAVAGLLTLFKAQPMSVFSTPPNLPGLVSLFQTQLMWILSNQLQMGSPRSFKPGKLALGGNPSEIPSLSPPSLPLSKSHHDCYARTTGGAQETREALSKARGAPVSLTKGLGTKWIGFG